MENWRGCGKRLTPVEGRERHPWPRCDPEHADDWLLTPEQLAELAVLYPETTTQEAVPT